MVISLILIVLGAVGLIMGMLAFLRYWRILRAIAKNFPAVNAPLVNLKRWTYYWRSEQRKRLIQFRAKTDDIYWSQKADEALLWDVMSYVFWLSGMFLFWLGAVVL